MRPSPASKPTPSTARTAPKRRVEPLDADHGALPLNERKKGAGLDLRDAGGVELGRGAGVDELAHEPLQAGQAR